MKQNLTTTVNVTSTYSGEFAGQYVNAMLLAGKTLGEGNIEIKNNIKYKQVLKKLATSGLIAAGSCDFTSSGTIALTEAILEPKEMQVNIELCKSDFDADWEAVSMGYSAFDVLPKNFTDFLIGNISASIGAELETAIWQYNSVFSGFTTLFKGDATVVDVSGTTITPTNVQNELIKVCSAVADLKIYSASEKPKLYCATNVIYSYLISLGGLGSLNGYDNKGPAGLPTNPMFAGFELVEAPGMKSSEIVAAQKSNLVFGTGLLNDTNEVKVLDMANIDGSKNVRFISRFTANVNYIYGSEIVYYWIY